MMSARPPMWSASGWVATSQSIWERLSALSCCSTSLDEAASMSMVLPSGNSIRLASPWPTSTKRTTSVPARAVPESESESDPPDVLPDASSLDAASFFFADAEELFLADLPLVELPFLDEAAFLPAADFFAACTDERALWTVEACTEVDVALDEEAAPAPARSPGLATPSSTSTTNANRAPRNFFELSPRTKTPPFKLIGRHRCYPLART